MRTGLAPPRAFVPLHAGLSQGSGLSNAADVVVEFEEQLRLRTTAAIGKGRYLAEVSRLKVAQTGYWSAARRLGVVADLGTMTKPGSRHVVRKVLLPGGVTGVLKLVGNLSEPGEPEALAEWRRHGLPAAEPLGGGVVLGRDGEGDPRPTLYSLTRYLEGTRSLQKPVDLAAQVAMTRHLLDFLVPFHASGAVPPQGARRIGDVLQHHLDETVPILEHHGLRLPSGWHRALANVDGRGHHLVHADLVAVNFLTLEPESPDARPSFLIDPAGAVSGPVEAALGRLCFQMSSAEHVSVLTELTVSRDPTVQLEPLEAVAGLHIFIEAGYPLMPLTPPARGGDPAGIPAARERSEFLLDTADRLFQPYLRSLGRTPIALGPAPRRTAPLTAAATTAAHRT